MSSASTGGRGTPAAERAITTGRIPQEHKGEISPAPTATRIDARSWRTSDARTRRSHLNVLMNAANRTPPR